MLMISSSMGMLDGVHGNTPNARPVVPLGLHLVPDVSSLQERLVGPSSAGNDANHGTADRWDCLTSAGRQLYASLLSILGVSDDDARGA